MWYIFPQIQGLGKSSTSQYYAVSSLEEAAQFLEESYLSKNFYVICEALMQLDTSNATEVFGRPDDMKLRSSMTLFAYVAGEQSFFNQVLGKYFHGKYDNRTKRILNME